MGVGMETLYHGSPKFYQIKALLRHFFKEETNNARYSAIKIEQEILEDSKINALAERFEEAGLNLQEIRRFVTTCFEKCLGQKKNSMTSEFVLELADNVIKNAKKYEKDIQKWHWIGDPL